MLNFRDCFWCYCFELINDLMDNSFILRYVSTNSIISLKVMQQFFIFSLVEWNHHECGEVGVECRRNVETSKCQRCQGLGAQYRFNEKRLVSVGKNIKFRLSPKHIYSNFKIHIESDILLHSLPFIFSRYFKSLNSEKKCIKKFRFETKTAP